MSASYNPNDDRKPLLAILREQILAHLSQEELEALQEALDIPDHHLSSENFTARIESLLSFLERQGRLGEIVDYLRSQHPSVDWIESQALPTHEGPYRGLQSFREIDAHLFYGRERYSQQLFEKVSEQNLVAVIGPSGSGKSSVVFAGLLPVLRSQGDWLIADLRPGDRPFRALSSILIEHLAPALGRTARTKEKNRLAGELQNGDLQLRDVVEDILEVSANEKKFLLVVDQFEELYTQCQDDEIRHLWIDILLDTTISLNAFCLVLTLRGDFVGRALSYGPLADALQNNDLKLGPMNRKELQQAIERPILKEKYYFEPELVKRILDDVKEEAGQLPLLEFALTLLWQRAENGRLTHHDYEVIGGVSGALLYRAEEEFRIIEKRKQQDLARDFFMRLVALPSGKSADFTRRRVSWNELIPRKEWVDAQARLIYDLSHPDVRLITADTDYVELTHEILIDNWRRMMHWLTEQQAWLPLLRRMTGSAQAWENDNYDESYLYRGAQLSQVREAVPESALSALEILFLEKSVLGEGAQKQQTIRQRRRLRFAYGALLILGFIALAAVVLPIFQEPWARVENFPDNQVLSLALPAAGEMVYAGSENLGFFYGNSTTDWERRHAGLPLSDGSGAAVGKADEYVRSVSKLAVDPCDDSHIAAGVVENGIYELNGLAATWEPAISSSLRISSADVFSLALYRQFIFAVLNKDDRLSFYFSDDSGENWQLGVEDGQLSDQILSVFVPACQETEEAPLYFGFEDGFYRATVADPLAWSQLTATPPVHFIAQTADKTAFYLATYDVMKNETALYLWPSEDPSKPLAVFSGRVPFDLVAHPVLNNVVYLLLDGGAAYKVFKSGESVRLTGGSLFNPALALLPVWAGSAVESRTTLYIGRYSGLYRLDDSR